jgi:hypothetical protein
MQINNTLDGLTITAIAPHPTLKKTNIVKIDFFFESINEDSNKWIEKFEHTKDTNN